MDITRMNLREIKTYIESEEKRQLDCLAEKWQVGETYTNKEISELTDGFLSPQSISSRIGICRKYDESLLGRIKIQIEQVKQPRHYICTEDGSEITLTKTVTLFKRIR